MGIHDLLSSSDHEWCQWFAYQLVSEGFFSGKEAFHGMLYPSRKNRGEDAIALFSGYINRKPVRAKIRYTTVAFNKTDEYKALKRSNFRISAP
jgi:hypothetical protein